MKKIDCTKCRKGSECCQVGAWVDLEEAKKILPLKLKGDFCHFEQDDDFPSGYKLGTSNEDEPCSFLTSDGLCSIHKIDYALKPSHCKEFPYEKGELSRYVEVLCGEHKRMKKEKKTASKRRSVRYSK